MNKPLKNLSLLVVDDEPDILEVLTDELVHAGATVVQASCGNEAVKHFANQTFDLILTDANMPNGSGMDLLGNIRRQNPSLPFVIFITGQSEFSQAQAYAAGASAIFSKPTKFPQLIAKILQLTTAPEKRWTRKSERIQIETKVALHFNSLNSSIESKALDIGQGGMFVHATSQFPDVGSSIEFEFKFDNESLINQISGTGIVRWIRPVAIAPLQAGYGIEFAELEDLPRFLNFLNQLKTPSFIPLG